MTHREKKPLPLPMPVNRRKIIQCGLQAAGSLWVLGGVSAKGYSSAIDRIQIACIGVGGKGSSDCDHASNHGEIVALCDVDDQYLNAKAERFPQAMKYHDFREMLTDLGDKIDGVVISTTDHTHACAAAMALRMNKHVYCQKPLTHTVKEARLLQKLAAEHRGLATQMGNQGTADRNFRRAVQVLQSGVIGQVTEVHVWSDRPKHFWVQSPTIVARPTESPPIPATMHWDLWLGPAPQRPYHPAYHPLKWRGFMDFGNGALGDMGCHSANLPFMALKLGYPSSISAESAEMNSETYPAWSRITFQFPARGELAPVQFIWYEGQDSGRRILPPGDLQTRVLRHDEALSSGGAILVGDRGWMYVPDDFGRVWRLLPKKDFDNLPDYSVAAKMNQVDDDMKAEWFAAIRGGPKPWANFDYAGPLTEFILLGNCALRAGKKLDWDAENMRFSNALEADRFLHREYRRGWEL